MNPSDSNRPRHPRRRRRRYFNPDRRHRPLSESERTHREQDGNRDLRPAYEDNRRDSRQEYEEHREPHREHQEDRSEQRRSNSRSWNDGSRDRYERPRSEARRSQTRADNYNHSMESERRSSRSGNPNWRNDRSYDRSYGRGDREPGNSRDDHYRERPDRGREDSFRRDEAQEWNKGWLPPPDRVSEQNNHSRDRVDSERDRHRRFDRRPRRRPQESRFQRNGENGRRDNRGPSSDQRSRYSDSRSERSFSRQEGDNFRSGHRRGRGRRGGRGRTRHQQTSQPPSPLRDAAKRLGIRQLYPEQQRIISKVMEGRDVLVILPTGFGKSACYQIPSMLLPKPVVLVSPLLALIHDQQAKLTEKGIECVRIDGTLKVRELRDALARVSQGGSLLVMTTPESLGSEGLKQALQTSGVSLVAVDEAHCVSEWGHDFRPAYLRIASELEALGRPPRLALTATATPQVREDIIRALSLKEPERVESSPHRGNLTFSVVCEESYAKARPLMRFVKRLQRPGMIYCTTTKNVDAVYVVLRKLRIPAHHYHGKMVKDERAREQGLYMKQGRRTVMVATSAFGLGIDKPDIRYVIHYESPASLEQYMQEAGRAGRDGRLAKCILLYDPADRDTHIALLNQSRVRAEHVLKLARTLMEWAKEERLPTLSALAVSAGLGKRITDAVFSAFLEAGLVAKQSDRTIKLCVPVDALESQASDLARKFETLRVQDNRRLDAFAEYAATKECRSVFLSRYFGEERGKPCGMCDNCRPKREV